MRHWTAFLPPARQPPRQGGVVPALQRQPGEPGGARCARQRLAAAIHVDPRKRVFHFAPGTGPDLLVDPVQQPHGVAQGPEPRGIGEAAPGLQAPVPGGDVGRALVGDAVQVHQLVHGGEGNQGRGDRGIRQGFPGQRHEQPGHRGGAHPLRVAGGLHRGVWQARRRRGEAQALRGLREREGRGVQRVDQRPAQPFQLPGGGDGRGLHGLDHGREPQHCQGAGDRQSRVAQPSQPAQDRREPPLPDRVKQGSRQCRQHKQHRAEGQQLRHRKRRPRRQSVQRHQRGPGHPPKQKAREMSGDGPRADQQHESDGQGDTSALAPSAHVRSLPFHSVARIRSAQILRSAQDDFHGGTLSF